jgi:wyosine [tRNA(Phe)-imidazoG37] synthetase (radical SAM superfamily)
VREVDPEVLRTELAGMIEIAQSGALFTDPSFADVPDHLRAIRDIAFSGDGEPTTCTEFRRCVEIAGELKQLAGLPDVKLVLITDACYLTKPEVEAGLRLLDEHNGEIWAKLDAGTEAYYRLVNRPNYPLRHVMENIIAAARVRPIVIQSIFMRMDGAPPTDEEIAAYTDRLNEIVLAGGRIKLVQVYTIARRPAESFVSALTDKEADRITDAVRDQTGLPAKTYYGACVS